MSADPPPLSPTYYLDNAERMLAGAEQRYGDLLSDREIRFLKDFRALQTSSRCLWVRLAGRKGSLFRVDRISYEEVGDLEVAIDELKARGFATDGADATAPELTHRLVRYELSAICRELGVTSESSAGTRRALDLALRTVPQAVVASAARSVVEFVRLCRTTELATFRLLYFGNLHQDWSEFVLADLARWRYEPYLLRSDLRRFGDRRAIDHTLEAAALKITIRTLRASGDLDGAATVARDAIDRPRGWHELAASTVSNAVCEAARDLERVERLEQALELYACCQGPPARERRARVLEKLGRSYEAIALCDQIAADPHDEGERLFAPHFAHTLRRRLAQVAPLYRARRPRKLLRVTRDDSRQVELLALEALESRGTRGIHTENWLWRSLFGLCFWDVIFATVPGVFEHPFQAAPLDLWGPAFRSSRRTAIAACLAEVSDGGWSASRILALWDEKRGTRNALVGWSDGVRAALDLVARAVPASDLAYIFERFSQDPRRYCTGFPDLFVIQAEGYRLLEVKGPADQLRAEQRAWLDYLVEGGVSAHLLAVEWR